MIYKDAINSYLAKHSYTHISLKAVLFDMDGVLYNSMPYHADSWNRIMAGRGLNLPKAEAYLHEGRTGAATINIVFRRELGRDATPEEIETIYKEKVTQFNTYPDTDPMPGAYDLLQKVKSAGLTPVIVTGSGQKSLLGRLDNNFPDIFRPELMVTAYDVKYGKPNPEPYLMALKKANLQPYEAIVVENAPLGVEAGVAAGVFTVAVNTGPLDDKVLTDAGANLLFHSMEELSEKWEELKVELL